jgi:hypothetical protein
MTSTMRKWVMIGMGGLTTLSLASPAFARTISLKDAGLAFWIFVVIGTIIILLQLVPAAILFFSFIGTTTALMLRRRKAKKEKKAEAEVLTEVGSAKVK